jgi:pimeloyl-ACP methyl ester carboxylesterase
VLRRGEAAAPVRYRVIVIPGSGCAGMQPIADRYFAGLLHAELLVLHKPGVDPRDWPAPQRCSRRFTQWDDLGAWLEAATAALSAEFQLPSSLPVVLVGVSEGGELLPALAARFPQIRMLVLIGSAGLDPAEVAALQAAREGDEAGWQKVLAAIASTQPDTAVLDGRTLKYWRTLNGWQVQQSLHESGLPLLQAWGSADDAVPSEAYRRFMAAMQDRTAPYCALPFQNADHGLQSPAHDHLQDVWARVELWARGSTWCPD